jgi:hypothetical protein
LFFFKLYCSCNDQTPGAIEIGPDAGSLIKTIPDPPAFPGDVQPVAPPPPPVLAVPAVAQSAGLVPPFPPPPIPPGVGPIPGTLFP